MTSFIQIFIISVSLALDALSVSIAGGMNSQKAKTVDALKIATFFGLFQSAMPLIGWAIGEVLSNFVMQFAHWIAFGLLSVIGIKMIKESLSTVESKTKNILENKKLIILSFATSIDALIVGITLSLLKIPLILSVIIIGVITFILCFFGFIFGKKLGNIFGKRVEIIGGIALTAIGIKILLEHFI